MVKRKNIGQNKGCGLMENHFQTFLLKGNTMKTKTILLICAIVMLLDLQITQAEILIFNTSDNPFTPGVKNQGWWSDTVSNAPITDNYSTGFSHGGEHRNYFTFDLSSLSLTVVAATIEVRRFNYHSSAESETLGLFDVSTGAAVLNAKNGINSSIFEDLGSGVCYAQFEVLSSGNSEDVLSVELNSAAVADINLAAGGWFSLGGTLLSPGSPSYEGVEVLFGGSHEENGPQRLVLEVIPEPTSIVLFILGGLALNNRKRCNC